MFPTRAYSIRVRQFKKYFKLSLIDHLQIFSSEVFSKKFFEVLESCLNQLRLSQSIQPLASSFLFSQLKDSEIQGQIVHQDKNRHVQIVEKAHPLSDQREIKGVLIRRNGIVCGFCHACMLLSCTLSKKIIKTGLKTIQELSFIILLLLEK